MILFFTLSRYIKGSVLTLPADPNSSYVGLRVTNRMCGVIAHACGMDMSPSAFKERLARAINKEQGKMALVENEEQQTLPF
ncbi:MAG: hypothetical protein Q8P93_00315 [bacterium]|nr:hypothetical protein [bacterium]